MHLTEIGHSLSSHAQSWCSEGKEARVLSTNFVPQLSGGGDLVVGT